MSSPLVWTLAFAGFAYAIALKTGDPAAVNSTFLLFFPFLFLTTSYVPRRTLSGWLNTVAGFNPVTYLRGGLRSLEVESGVRYNSSVEGSEKALGPGTQGAGRLGGDIGAAGKFLEDCRRFVVAAESGETIG